MIVTHSTRAAGVSSRCPRSAPKDALPLHRIVSAQAPRIAPQKPPTGKHEPPQRSILADRVDRVLGTRGVVLAPLRQRGGDHDLIAAHKPDQERPDGPACFPQGDGQHPSPYPTREALRSTSSTFSSTAVNPLVSRRSTMGARAMSTKSTFSLSPSTLPR